MDPRQNEDFEHEEMEANEDDLSDEDESDSDEEIAPADQVRNSLRILELCEVVKLS